MDYARTHLGGRADYLQWLGGAQGSGIWSHPGIEGPITVINYLNPLADNRTEARDFVREVIRAKAPYYADQELRLKEPNPLAPGGQPQDIDPRNHSKLLSIYRGHIQPELGLLLGQLQDSIPSRMQVGQFDLAPIQQGPPPIPRRVLSQGYALTPEDRELLDRVQARQGLTYQEALQLAAEEALEGLQDESIPESEFKKNLHKIQIVDPEVRDRMLRTLGTMAMSSSSNFGITTGSRFLLTWLDSQGMDIGPAGRLSIPYNPSSAFHRTNAPEPSIEDQARTKASRDYAKMIWAKHEAASRDPDDSAETQREMDLAYSFTRPKFGPKRHRSQKRMRTPDEQERYQKAYEIQFQQEIENNLSRFQRRY